MLEVTSIELAQPRRWHRSRSNRVATIGGPWGRCSATEAIAAMRAGLRFGVRCPTGRLAALDYEEVAPFGLFLRVPDDEGERALVALPWCSRRSVRP